MNDSPVFLRIYASPVGDLMIYTTNTELIALTFSENDEIVRDRLGIKWPSRDINPLGEATVRQLEEYFKGTRTRFNLPMKPEGTLFQRNAWEYLQSIPYGEVLSYSQQARNMSREKATRSIGSANAKNPICIIIPCHRVIGSDGTVTGYAGPKWVKEKLLELEGYSFLPKAKLKLAKEEEGSDDSSRTNKGARLDSDRSEVAGAWLCGDGSLPL